MQNHFRRSWSQQEDDLLMDMVAEDLKFRDIAAQLGRSRNSCIGRMFRLREQIERRRAYREPEQTSE
jgi:hypothetical protein